MSAMVPFLVLFTTLISLGKNTGRELYFENFELGSLFLSDTLPVICYFVMLWDMQVQMILKKRCDAISSIYS